MEASSSSSITGGGRGRGVKDEQTQTPLRHPTPPTVPPSSSSPRLYAPAIYAPSSSTVKPISSSSSAITPPSRYLITVIPPTHLPHDPPITNKGYGPAEHFRRGTLLPLYSTLSAQLVAIAREYGLPTAAGLVVYLAGEEGGPRINDAAWTMLWGRLFQDQLAEEEESRQRRSNERELDQEDEEAEDEEEERQFGPPPEVPALPVAYQQRRYASETDSNEGQEPSTLSYSQPHPPPTAPSTTNGIASPVPSSSSHSPRFRSHPHPIPSPSYSQTKFRPLRSNLSHSQHDRSYDSMYAPSTRSTSVAEYVEERMGAQYGSAMIVGKLEFEIDRRGRGQWYDRWIDRSSQNRSAGVAAVVLGEEEITTTTAGNGHSSPRQELVLPSLVEKRRRTLGDSNTGEREMMSEVRTNEEPSPSKSTTTFIPSILPSLIPSRRSSLVSAALLELIPTPPSSESDFNDDHHDDDDDEEGGYEVLDDEEVEEVLTAVSDTASLSELESSAQHEEVQVVEETEEEEEEEEEVSGSDVAALESIDPLGDIFEDDATTWLSLQNRHTIHEDADDLEIAEGMVETTGLGIIGTRIAELSANAKEVGIVERIEPESNDEAGIVESEDDVDDVRRLLQRLDSDSTYLASPIRLSFPEATEQGQVISNGSDQSEVSEEQEVDESTEESKVQVEEPREKRKGVDRALNLAPIIISPRPPLQDRRTSDNLLAPTPSYDSSSLSPLTPSDHQSESQRQSTIGLMQNLDDLERALADLSRPTPRSIDQLPRRNGNGVGHTEINTDVAPSSLSGRSPHVYSASTLSPSIPAFRLESPQSHVSSSPSSSSSLEVERKGSFEQPDLNSTPNGVSNVSSESATTLLAPPAPPTPTSPTFNHHDSPVPSPSPSPILRSASPQRSYLAYDQSALLTRPIAPILPPPSSSSFTPPRPGRSFEDELDAMTNIPHYSYASSPVAATLPPALPPKSPQATTTGVLEKGKEKMEMTADRPKSAGTNGSGRFSLKTLRTSRKSEGAITTATAGSEKSDSSGNGLFSMFKKKDKEKHDVSPIVPNSPFSSRSNPSPTPPAAEFSFDLPRPSGGSSFDLSRPSTDVLRSTPQLSNAILPGSERLHTPSRIDSDETFLTAVEDFTTSRSRVDSLTSSPLKGYTSGKGGSGSNYSYNTSAATRRNAGSAPSTPLKSPGKSRPRPPVDIDLSALLSHMKQIDLGEEEIGTADELRTPSTTTTSATSSSDVSSPIARPPPVPTHTLDEPPARPSRRQQDQLENNSRLRPIPTDVVPSVPSLISRE